MKDRYNPTDGILVCALEGLGITVIKEEAYNIALGKLNANESSIAILDAEYNIDIMEIASETNMSASMALISDDNAGGNLVPTFEETEIGFEGFLDTMKSKLSEINNKFNVFKKLGDMFSNRAAATMKLAEAREKYLHEVEEKSKDDKSKLAMVGEVRNEINTVTKALLTSHKTKDGRTDMDWILKGLNGIDVTGGDRGSLVKLLTSMEKDLRANGASNIVDEWVRTGKAPLFMEKFDRANSEMYDRDFNTTLYDNYTSKNSKFLWRGATIADTMGGINKADALMIDITKRPSVIEGTKVTSKSISDVLGETLKTYDNDSITKTVKYIVSELDATIIKLFKQNGVMKKEKDPEKKKLYAKSCSTIVNFIISAELAISNFSKNQDNHLFVVYQTIWQITDRMKNHKQTNKK